MRLRAVTAAVGLCLAAGCTGGTGEPPVEPEGTFALPAEAEVSCLEHQEQSPGVAYTGGADGDTAAIFAMLRYWASNGDKPYCDGEPATAEDVQWRNLVEDLGAVRPPDPPAGTPDGDQPVPEPSSPEPSSPESTEVEPTPETT